MPAKPTQISRTQNKLKSMSLTANWTSFRYLLSLLAPICIIYRGWATINSDTKTDNMTFSVLLCHFIGPELVKVFNNQWFSKYFAVHMKRLYFINFLGE